MSFVVSDPHKYRGQVVANGHCVRYAQVACPSLPHTSQWKRGKKVKGGNVPKGTVIATFGSDGKYENRTDGASHAAILIEDTPGGLRVWDQWVGHPVSERTIQHRGSGRKVNDGEQFYVVEV